MKKIFITLVISALSLVAVAQDSLLIAKSDSLEAKAEELFDTNNIEQAIEVVQEALQIRKDILGEEDDKYLESLNNLGVYLIKKENYIDALKCSIKALKIREKIKGKDDLDYALSLNNVMTCHMRLNNYSEAIKLGTESRKIYEDKHVINSEYLILLSNLFLLYTNINKYNDAFEIGKYVLDATEKLEGKKSKSYIIVLANLATVFHSIDEYKKSLYFSKEALNLAEEVLGVQDPLYAGILNNILVTSTSNNSFSDAISLANKALKVIEKKQGKECESYTTLLSNLSSVYQNLGDHQEAIRLISESLEIQSRFNYRNLNYALSLSKLASYNSAIDNIADAIKYGTEALYLLKDIVGEKNTDYISNLRNLSIFNSQIGNFKQAIKLGEEALNLAEKTVGKEKSSYAFGLNNLARIFFEVGNYEKAIEFETEALRIREHLTGKNNLNFAFSLFTLASFQNKMGNNSESINLCTEAKDIIEKIVGKNHPYYASTLSSLAYYNYQIGNINEAIKLEEEALNIRTNILSNTHDAVITSINHLMAYYLKQGNINAIKKYLNQYYSLTTQRIKKSFAGLTENERAFLWNKCQATFNKIHLITHDYPYSSIIEDACNAILFSKSLLLSTSQEMRSLIAKSGDSATMALYDEMKMNRLMLDRLYEKPIKERFLSTDSLEQVVNNLERKLIDKSKVYGDYTRNLMIKWRDVQRALGAKDVAVEFVSFDLNEDSTMYVAYVNKPGIDCPIFVPLFEEKQLKTRLTIPKDHSTQEGKMLAVADAYLPSQQVSELVWEPLAQYLDGAESIYFAPSGELYNLAIESLTDWENSDRLMSDRWPGLCRVSSTREIAINRDRQPINSSVTYGGLKYDMNADLLTADSKKYGSQGSTLETSSLMAMVKGQSGDTWRDMPITLDEASSVHESLNKAGVDDTPYLEEAGTESSFKSLSGQRKNMMFLSTHGFFWNTDEAKKHRREHTLQFVSLGNEDRHQSVEDMAMTRSGLLFSGANYAWQGNELPDGVDDGFLTAKEISQLDLRGLGLVVLSACQTGLGDVSGEGVFGLQRGFKKAGAQSILMSLWEVNAYSTKLLMTEFCKNVFEKRMTKRDALRAAQETVKNFTGDPESLAIKGINITSHGVDKNKKDKKTKQQTEDAITQPASDNHPFAHPYYWAGFILLDALD